MLVDDMTEGGIYGLHMVNDIYPEGDGDPSDFIVPTPSKKDLRDKINGWLMYHCTTIPIRVDPGLMDIAMKFLFDIDLTGYTKRISNEGKERILSPFEFFNGKLGDNMGIDIFLPQPADANKIPIMINGLSGKRFAFVMPMLQFKEKVFPRNVIELYNE